MKNYQVVEYSIKQKCFHTHTLSDMITVNNRIISQNKSSDYLPIGMFDTYEEASKFIETMRPKLQGYDKQEVEDGYLNQYQP